ncbi:type II toxin-antitoxin system antitoxin SocA domain-containing protein [endosymbiont GvMRE of Glomus versiforme]|uniref:type II toxin-antitoxin system antitoxin SocA domain-containing protein n=1 Tax=endosymbiont GvMRE of Glomus versiforme TaxID=2039283 RepID=UPI0011C49A3A|nr:type II toxin-antitoxin system antitoxin SocA domain-containing protein [endosymbiont GvMRE of Glomus versiforme]
MEKKQTKILNIVPLSLAKYFYEKGIEDIGVIQDLIYLTYLEVLKKENILLFSEEWQAWNSGPVIESVFYAMNENWKDKDRKKLFQKTLPLTQKNIIKHCEKQIKDYQIIEQEKDQYKLLGAVQTEPWKLARRNLDNELEKNKIETADIIRFAQQQIRI